MRRPGLDKRLRPGPARYNERRGLIDLGATSLTEHGDRSAVFGFGCGCFVSLYFQTGDYFRAGDHLTSILPGCPKNHPIQWQGLR